MIANFTFTEHENGNTIFAEDADTVFKAIQVVTQALINSVAKSALLPADFAGSTQIPNGAPVNSFLYIDASGNLNVITKTTFDNNVAAAAGSAASAAASALAAAVSAAEAAVSAQTVANFTSQTGIVATGTFQSTTTQLTMADNFKLFEVTDVASGTGVRLPPSQASYRAVIANYGANALNVFPVGTGTIDGGAQSQPIRIQPNETVIFFARDGANNWTSTSPLLLNGNLPLNTMNGEMARVTASGRILVGTTTENFSGSKNGVMQLKEASNSGIYVGNTPNSAASVFDFYEEGTFTPIVYGSSSAGSGTYTYQVGRYTRYGNRVFISINLTWTAHTGTGNMDIRGLPFTSINGASSALAVTYSGMLVGASKQLTARVGGNGTSIDLIASDYNGGIENLVAIDTAVLNLTITGFYEV